MKEQMTLDRLIEGLWKQSVRKTEAGVNSAVSFETVHSIRNRQSKPRPATFYVLSQYVVQAGL